MTEKIKFLSSNSSGKDIFGGIHTHFQEHIKLSPKHHFNIIELNNERKYLSQKNKTIRKYDVNALTGHKYIKGVLTDSENFENFLYRSEKIISEYQNTINAVNPDVIMIFGTSIPSYYLLEATKREGKTKKILHSYAGVLEKEIGSYGGKSQIILKEMGKKFTNKEIINDITYIFPSNLCKETVEEIHQIEIQNSHVIPNGVSEIFHNLKVKRIPPKEFSLGFVGRLSPVKNPDLFLSMNNFLKKPAKLKIITDIYAGANQPSGQSLLKKMTSGEIFYFHPRQSQKLMKFYKTELSVNLVPSLFETFCNVATESLVSGTPTILSDRAGAKDIFKKYGLEQLIFSIEDMDSLRNSLEFAKSIDYKIPEKLSAEIYEELKWEKTIKKYNSIAEEIANKK